MKKLAFGLGLFAISTTCYFGFNNDDSERHRFQLEDGTDVVLNVRQEDNGRYSGVVEMSTYENGIRFQPVANWTYSNSYFDVSLVVVSTNGVEAYRLPPREGEKSDDHTDFLNKRRMEDGFRFLFADGEALSSHMKNCNGVDGCIKAKNFVVPDIFFGVGRESANASWTGHSHGGG
jgi:hypothetical protein